MSSSFWIPEEYVQLTHILSIKHISNAIVCQHSHTSHHMHTHTHRHIHTLSMTEGASENQAAAYGLSWYQSLAVWSCYAKSLNPYLWWMLSGMEGGDETEIWGQLYWRLSTVLGEKVLTKIPGSHCSRRRITWKIMSEGALHYDSGRNAGGVCWEQEKLRETCCLSADLRFTLTSRPLASQQRNYKARGVIAPAWGRLSLLFPWYTTRDRTASFFRGAHHWGSTLSLCIFAFTCSSCVIFRSAGK